MAKKGTKKYPAWFNPKEEYQRLVKLENALLSMMEDIDNPTDYLRCEKALKNFQRTKRSYAKYV